jgi:hypothetical protein
MSSGVIAAMIFINLFSVVPYLLSTEKYSPGMESIAAAMPLVAAISVLTVVLSSGGAMTFFLLAAIGFNLFFLFTVYLDGQSGSG